MMNPNPRTMTFLASPYSSADPLLREQRARLAAKACAELIHEGRAVFSPIVHSHAVCAVGGIDSLDPLWYAQAETLLRKCDSVIVLMLDGWRESKGVRAEIKLAHELNLPVEYREP